MPRPWHCFPAASEPPPQLLVLTAASTVADGTARSGEQSEALVILSPAVPRKLDTNRVPVQASATSIAYLKDAIWSDKPATLMQQLMMETVAAKNDRLVLREVNSGGKAQEILSGTLQEFGVDARTNEAVVIYDAVKMVRGKAVKKQRFEVRRPVSVIEPVPVSIALNDAANDLASEIAAWLKS